MSVNKVILLGRLGQDPELKHSAAGVAVCNLSLATSEKWTDKNGTKNDRVEWHRVVVWGKLAELCNQYLKKGRQAFIEGKLQTRSWDDKNDQKRYITEINATTVQFIGNESSTGDDSQKTPEPQREPSGDENKDFTSDDIPF